MENNKNNNDNNNKSNKYVLYGLRLMCSTRNGVILLSLQEYRDLNLRVSVKVIKNML